jgi:Zn-dependent protease with chaperone function/tetratricopeptide (TPR) repeat protein
MPSSAPAANLPAVEKPLGDTAKLSLVLTAALVIALFYAFVIGSIAVLVLVLALELVAFAFALRFGISRFLIPGVRRRTGLVTLFVRSFRVRRHSRARVPLSEGDAPRLFAVLAQLAERIQVRPPREVIVEMSSGAWVELKGFRRGASQTTLGIGYDVLAGLSEREVEAVLAHEMVHAKSVRRGLWHWLLGGINRAAKLTNELSAHVGAFRRAKKRFLSGEALLVGADRGTRLAARLIATYSRQDEFEADLGAARICGAAPLRSALIKLGQMAPVTARIRWNERVAQLQTGNGFSSWLVSELAVGDLAQEEAREGGVTDRYSTHPSLRDRLAALPPDERTLEESPPAVQLLVGPDTVARRLVEEIHRIAAADEARDSAERRRWVRRLGRSGNLLPIQVLGAALAGCGLLVMAFSWKTSFSAWELLFGALVVGGGATLVRLGRYRDKRALPVPDFAAVKAAAERIEDAEARKAREKEVEADLRKRSAKLPGRRRCDFLVDEAYAALGRCDYLAGHVAARLCLELDKRSVEARLALGVAWAAFRNVQNTNNTVRAIAKMTGLHTPASLWGTAWCYMQLGDWMAAESFLLEAMRLSGNPPRLAAFAASCQLRRGKLQSGVANAKTALAAAPGDMELCKLLAHLLIGAGFLKEAEDILASRSPGTPADSEFEVLAIRLMLLQGGAQEARRRTDELLVSATAPEVDLRLGEAYEASRDDAKASWFFDRALEKGHYPEARLGLARLLAHRDDKKGARAHLLAAITSGRPVGEKSLPYWQVFRLALRQLALLENPVSGAEAWQATIAANAEYGILANQTFLVFASDQKAAEGYLRTVTDAVLGGKPPLQPTALKWKVAERDRQPAGAVRPGVQAYWRE